ncbi:MAG TPA: serine/threonine-protein kinase [Kofleriaceae bacterium]
MRGVVSSIGSETPRKGGSGLLRTAHPLEQFGDFTIREMLGEGGMAYVHLAERAGWEEDGVPIPVALKRLFPELVEEDQFVEAFQQEARIAQLLQHPNIVRAYDHGRIDDTHWIAMEYVPGPTLRSLMVQARTAAGAIPLRITVHILMQMCSALAAAHGLRDERGRALGLVHRDVSPANIIVSTEGEAKLIDFGIAKAAFSRVRTQAGFIKGKISYVAPEYTRGRLDARADLFAVGVIAHEMLTNRRLFDGDDQVAVLHKVRDQRLHPPSHHDRNIPRELDDIVMLGLQRDPDKRWQTASAMLKALAGVARQLGAPVTGREVAQWIDWAFSKEPVRDSVVANMLDGLDRPEVSSVRRRVTTSSKLAPAVRGLTDALRDSVETLDFDELELLEPTPAARPSARGTQPPAVTRLSPPLGEKSLSDKAIAEAIDRQLSYARPDTDREGVLDGWSPPTGTQMVRPAKTDRTMAFLAVVILVLAGTLATLLWFLAQRA